MIPVSFLYDEYIDRRKLTEQKKNPFEYIVPPPSRGVGTIKLRQNESRFNLAQLVCRFGYEPPNKHQQTLTRNQDIRFLQYDDSSMPLL